MNSGTQLAYSITGEPGSLNAMKIANIGSIKRIIIGLSSVWASWTVSHSDPSAMKIAPYST